MSSNLMLASAQCFNRPDDHRFETLDDMAAMLKLQHDRSKRELVSSKRWKVAESSAGLRMVDAETQQGHDLTAYSLGQLATFAKIPTAVLGRLTNETASRALNESLSLTMVDQHKDYSLLSYTNGSSRLRAINSDRYATVPNYRVVEALRQYDDLSRPQKAFNGATGLYAGDRDMFAFLVDPTGWFEVNGEWFTRGVCVWNSEVGARSFGVQTFYFQRVCCNHIIWGADQTTKFRRRHIGKDIVTECLNTMNDMIESSRRQAPDGFAAVVKAAMEAGVDADKAAAILATKGLSKQLAQAAIESADKDGHLTVWALVDAITRLAREESYTAERMDVDRIGASLLTEVATAA